VPEPSYLDSKQMQRVVVHGHSIVAIVPRDYGSQPLAYFWDGMVHASPEFDFHLVQLRLQPFANRLPQQSTVLAFGFLRCPS
jgi:hypothetical protein